MNWIPADEVFAYTFAMREELKVVLKDSSYETQGPEGDHELVWPLGFVVFILVHDKILMQDVNEQLFIHWRQWIVYFPQLDTMQIPILALRSLKTLTVWRFIFLLMSVILQKPGLILTWSREWNPDDIDQRENQGGSAKSVIDSSAGIEAAIMGV